MTGSVKSRSKMLNIRLSEDEISVLRKMAEASGHDNVSTLVRHLLAQHVDSAEAVPTNKIRPQYEKPKRFWKSGSGRIYHGDSLGLLHRTLEPESVDLVVTSPPFGLIKKKAYGNEPAHRYLDWFRPFAEGIKRVLKSDGSLVIDIGPAWLEGVPAKSPYQFQLLLMLCEEFGFYLAQDFYWWNPCRMPAPAEWVNIRRLRVKDAVNPVWWLSPTPWPKASNRRVLTAYGKSQEKSFQEWLQRRPEAFGSCRIRGLGQGQWRCNSAKPYRRS